MKCIRPVKIKEKYKSSYISLVTHPAYWSVYLFPSGECFHQLCSCTLFRLEGEHVALMLWPESQHWTSCWLVVLAVIQGSVVVYRDRGAPLRKGLRAWSCLLVWVPTDIRCLFSLVVPSRPCLGKHKLSEMFLSGRKGKRKCLLAWMD